jgi:hypothetical protein
VPARSSNGRKVLLTAVFGQSLCGLEAAYESRLVNVVGEDALALELDYGQPLAVPSLELGIAADVDLLELERVPFTDVLEHLPRPLAEVAADRGEERDADAYG